MTAQFPLLLAILPAVSAIAVALLRYGPNWLNALTTFLDHKEERYERRTRFDRGEPHPDPMPTVPATGELEEGQGSEEPAAEPEKPLA